MMDIELEARAILAEREREARAALRVSEAKNGSDGLMAGFVGRLARLATRPKREAARVWSSRGLR